MKNDIINYNSKGLPHGYQELYLNGSLFVRGNSKNNRDVGYNEWHSTLLPHTKRTNFNIT